MHYKSSFQGQPFSRAHFKTSICPPLLHCYKSIHSKDNHSREPISRLDNVHPAALLQVHSFQGQPFMHEPISRLDKCPPLLLHCYKSHSSQGNHSHEPISRLLNVHHAALLQVYSFQGQPFSRAHFKTSDMSTMCCTATSTLIPRATILASPFQDLDMSTLCCTATSLRIPRTTILASPFQDLYMSTTCCTSYKSSHSKGNHSREPILRLHKCPPLLHYYKYSHLQVQPFIAVAHFKIVLIYHVYR